MDNKVTLCNICGEKGWKEFLAICNKCIDGAKHIYCMKDQLDEVPDHWLCEKCTVKSKCKESKSSAKLISSRVIFSANKRHWSELRQRHAWKTLTEGTSSSYHPPAKNYNTLLHRGLSCKTVETEEAKLIKDITSKLHISSNNSLQIVEVPDPISVKMNCTRPRVVLASPALFEDSSSYKGSKGVKRKIAFLSAKYPKSGNITVSGKTTFISGPILLGVGNCGQVDCTLSSSNHKFHKDKIHENWESDKLSQTKATAKLRKAYDKKPRIEEITLPKDFPIPCSNYRWKGKFQVQRGEGNTSTCVQIQAHVSKQNVPAAVDRLPEIIVLEEFPRLRMWSLQFMENVATEQDVVYFFANDHSRRAYYRALIQYMCNYDLVLKASLDGVELIIFPSDVLPKKFLVWNQRMFLWGVFREYKNGYLANKSNGV